MIIYLFTFFLTREPDASCFWNATHQQMPALDARPQIIHLWSDRAQYYQYFQLPLRMNKRHKDVRQHWKSCTCEKNNQHQEDAHKQYIIHRRMNNHVRRTIWTQEIVIRSKVSGYVGRGQGQRSTGSHPSNFLTLAVFYFSLT